MFHNESAAKAYNISDLLWTELVENSTFPTATVQSMNLIFSLNTFCPIDVFSITVNVWAEAYKSILRWAEEGFHGVLHW